MNQENRCQQGAFISTVFILQFLSVLTFIPSFLSLSIRINVPDKTSLLPQGPLQTLLYSSYPPFSPFIPSIRPISYSPSPEFFFLRDLKKKKKLLQIIADEQLSFLA